MKSSLFIYLFFAGKAPFLEKFSPRIKNTNSTRKELFAVRGTSDGLVIKECATGESDKLLTILTADKGKILVSAKGVRSLKSKNMALCRTFTYANFEYYERGGRYWLASGSINDSFFGLNSDIEALSLASYVVDVADELSGEGAPDELFLRVVLNTLYAIEKKLRPLEQIKGTFEFFAAVHAGFMPDVDTCASCKNPSSEALYLDVMNGCLICSDCLKSKNHPLTEGIPEYDRFSTRNILVPLTNEVIMAIRYVSAADPKRLFSFALTKEDDVRAFSRAGEIYLQNHLERGFDTLDFYRAVAQPIAKINN